MTFPPTPGTFYQGVCSPITPFPGPSTRITSPSFVSGGDFFLRILCANVITLAAARDSLGPDLEGFFLVFFFTAPRLGFLKKREVHPLSFPKRYPVLFFCPPVFFLVKKELHR